MKKPASRKPKKPHRSPKSKSVCPHCGQKGAKHFVRNEGVFKKPSGGPYKSPLIKESKHGFWICDIYFRPDGRRLQNYDVVFPEGYPKTKMGG